MKILVLSSEPITQLKPRIYRFCKLLARRNHLVVASVNELPGRSTPEPILEASRAAFDRLDIEQRSLTVDWRRAPTWTAPGWLWHQLPVRVALFSSAALRRQARRLITNVAPDLIHVDRARTCAFLDADLGIPTVIDLTDPVGWLLSELSRVSGRTKRLFLADESRRMWRYESSLTRRRAFLLFASVFGMEKFRSRFPSSWSSVVPNSLESNVEPARPMELAGGRPRVAFCGNLHYMPNVFGITRFVADTWQHVRQRLPSASLHIIGSRPHAAVRALGHHPSTFIYADVADPRQIVSACDIAIAPIPVCGGFPNKIIDAITQSAVPVIADANAVRGLGEPLASAILTAWSTEDWVRHIDTLCRSHDCRREYVGRAVRLATELLHEERIRGELERIYEESQHGSPPRL